ncbi:hypothetical protein wTei_03160 [Wolbachia endosymbiont of Drosophila simulans]|nr:hypothetical protein wYak_10340 [Wolbachia endosymbiont of Drosophila yakuba]QVU17327.1 hypothetical protein wSan_10940 [Wolbachia endosymbiont of Drosophila santomea]QWE32178.1 hypothetical protein wTei_03160 [Wolbachia endosymbiont of Drosophila simulans]
MTKLEYLMRLRNSWFDYWSQNIEQARRQHKFVIMGQQYTENEQRELLNIGAEPIVFNVTFAMAEKILNTVRGKRYDLELKVNGESKDPEIMQLMHNHITDLIFSQDHYVEYSKALKEAIIGGYSALYVGFGYNNEDIEDDELTFKIRAINGTESFFFDPHSNEPHKGDGRYCGIIHRLYKTSLEKMGFSPAKIAKLEFKDKDTVPYIEVTDLYLKKDGGITFYRFTNEEILETKELYGHRHLPLVFHGGCSHYIDNHEVTRPLGVMCHYAQKTYNHWLGKEVVLLLLPPLETQHAGFPTLRLSPLSKSFFSRTGLSFMIPQKTSFLMVTPTVENLLLRKSLLTFLFVSLFHQNTFSILSQVDLHPP